MVQVGIFFRRCVCVVAILLGTAWSSFAAPVNPAPVVWSSITSGVVNSWQTTWSEAPYPFPPSGILETTLEGWTGLALTHVGGGYCSTGGVTCGSTSTWVVDWSWWIFSHGHWEKDYWGKYIGPEADVFAVYYDHKFLAFVMDDPISYFSIFGLPKAVLKIFAFKVMDRPPGNVPEVPLPGALPLFASVLAGAYFYRRRKQSRGVKPVDQQAAV